MLSVIRLLNYWYQLLGGIMHLIEKMIRTPRSPREALSHVPISIEKLCVSALLYHPVYIQYLIRPSVVVIMAVRCLRK